MLNVQLHPADKGGCGMYRLIWPGRAVHATGGARVEIVEYDDPRARLKTMMMNDEAGEPHVHSVLEAPDCDVLVLQRPLSQLLAEAIPHVQAKGVAVVVELDDDFEAIHPNHSAYFRSTPRWTPDHNWQWLKLACREADLVTVTTPALAAKYAKHGRVKIIPNFLPDMWFRLPPKPVNDRDRVVVGWAGQVSAHPNDLKQVGCAVRQVVDEFGCLVGCVGTGASVARDLGVDEVQASGWVPITEYPAAVQHFDVGIVPLDLSPFNEAKSNLKGLEFAAAGTPFIASPTGPYRALLAEGCGALAHRGEWVTLLRNMVKSPVMRAMHAERNLAVVRERYRMADHLDLWVDAWEQARENATRRTLGKLARL